MSTASYLSMLLAETLALLASALLAGVANAGRRTVVCVAAAFAVSCAAAFAMRLPLLDLLAVHLTLAAACLALAGIGAACRATFVDPLDRIAVGTLAGLTLTLGLFVLGDIAATLTLTSINVLLLANPVVAVASAARIDIFHTPWLYDVSPIAHRDFQYPAWPAAAALYASVGAATFAAARALRTAARAGSINTTH